MDISHLARTTWSFLRRKRILTNVEHIYSRNLLTAWQLSRKLTPGIAKLELQGGALIQPESLRFIADSVSDISNGNVDRIAGECLNIHAHLANRLRAEFGWTVYLTLGSVAVLGNNWANFDPMTARHLLRQGSINQNIFRGHCWLTLPNLEIIDATIQTTLARQTGNSELIGNITAQNISNLANSFEYCPTILGEDYAKAVFGLGRVVN